MPTVEELVALAAERAAAEVELWIPENEGDRIAGLVAELGTMTTVYGPCYTATLEVVGDYVEAGKTKKTDSLVRVAFMGAVLAATYLRLRPKPDDLVAFHHHGMVTPKNGMNDYHNIVAAVIDSATGKAKVPVDFAVEVPTVQQVVNADPRTGEITVGRSPLEPREGEEPLEPPTKAK